MTFIINTVLFVLLLIWIALNWIEIRLHSKWLEQVSSEWQNTDDILRFMISDERKHRLRLLGNIRAHLKDRRKAT
jgi:hypothetical protein